MSTYRFLRFPIAPIIAGWVVASFSGCASPSYTDPARVGPFFTPANHSGDATLGGIRRVVVLPIWGGDQASPETAASLDPVFLTALQQEKRFEVISLSRDECRRRYGKEAMSSATMLPHDLFETLKRDFAADAVLFIDLTAYDPYKPITLGLRGKLAALEDSRLVWTFDNIYSSEAPTTANSARHQFLDRDRSVPTDLTRTALLSPSKFAAYAAASMFATLPPVVAAPARIAK